MSVSSERPSDVSVLSYPRIAQGLFKHLAAGLGIVLGIVVVHAAPLVFRGDGRPGALILIETFASLAAGWGPYLVTDGTWWFAAAIAVVAFLLPGALSTPRESQPISGLTLRKHYANIALLVSGVTVGALILALTGADYGDPSTGGALLLLTAATAVLVAVATLVSSHEGYDALSSLRSAKSQVEEDLKLRKSLVPSGVSLARLVWKAVLSGVAEFVVLPALLVGGLLLLGLAHVVVLDERVAVVVIGGWLHFSLATTVSLLIGTTATIGSIPRSILRVLVTAAIATVAVGVSAALLWNGGLGVQWNWVASIAVILGFAAAVLGYSWWLQQPRLPRILRYLFPRAVLEAMALATKRRDSRLAEKILEEQTRRREIAVARGEKSLLLP